MPSTPEKRSPSAPGELLLRSLPMPTDTSFNGDVFGGWIMSQLDLAGSILAKITTHTRTTTVSVGTMKFIRPVRVGDVVSCYGTVERVGTTSLTIRLEMWVLPILPERENAFQEAKVTETTITYVSLGDDGKKKVIAKDRIPPHLIN